MERILLPFETNVEKKTYLYDAFSLGVMKACLPNYDIWLCNRLINCNCRRNHGGYWNTESEDLWSTTDGGSVQQMIVFSPSTFNVNGFDLLTFNVELLKNGNYISGHYDEFYIPGAAFYSRYNYSHRYILRGFDNKKGVFHSAAYLSNGAYGELEIKYDDYLNAVVNNTFKIEPIYYYKVNTLYEAKIDIELISAQLEDYLASTNAQGIMPRVVYGIDVWDSLANYVIGIGNRRINLSFIRVFMEHKAIMYKRIVILTKMRYVNDSDIATCYYQKIYSPAQVVFNLAIKYNITRNSDLPARIAEAIRGIENHELGLINKVMDSIS